ncbi:phosphatase and actin regulator 1-like isoform X2 [Dysidea avara]|uniref:phosphatase and actin regulator 1-like isoform X2 n=1 Tax=Dysidea avara TaxID=196820 RepID=UPI00331D2804
MAAASDGRVEEVRGIRQRSASDSQILIQANGRPNQYQQQQSVDDMASTRKRLTFFQRLLRPWKWRRKKKSKKFVETSQNLERQLSIRSRREDLIKRGVLQPSANDDVFPRSSDAIQNTNNVVHNNLHDIPPANRGRSATTGGLVNSPPTASTTVENSGSPRLYNNFSNPQPSPRTVQSPKLKSPPIVPEKPPNSPAKLKRISGNNTNSPDSPKVMPHSPSTSSGGASRGVQFGAVETIPDEVRSFPSEPPAVPKKPARNSLSPVTTGGGGTPTATKNVTTSTSDPAYYVFSPDDDESSSEGDYDEDEPNSADGGLAAKVIRRDSVAILAERRRKEQIATLSKETRSVVEGTLSRRLSMRPTKEELQQRNILRNDNISEQEARDEFERKKGILTRKLSRRPTVKELREKRILIRFADYAEVIDALEYDRKADKPWTRLKPEDKAEIRKELNEFKRFEMEVHPESEYMTRFHKP